MGSEQREECMGVPDLPQLMEGKQTQACQAGFCQRCGARRSSLLWAVPACSAILTVLFLKTLGDAEVLLAPLKGN